MPETAAKISAWRSMNWGSAAPAIKRARWPIMAAPSNLTSTLGRLERRPLYARAPRINRAVRYMTQICAPGRLADFVRISLLVETVGGDTRRCGGAARRHNLELGALVLEDAEDSVAPPQDPALP